MQDESTGREAIITVFRQRLSDADRERFDAIPEETQHYIAVRSIAAVIDLQTMTVDGTPIVEAAQRFADAARFAMSALSDAIIAGLFGGLQSMDSEAFERQYARQRRRKQRRVRAGN